MSKYTYRKKLSQKQISQAVAEYVQKNPPKGLPLASWDVSVGFIFNPDAKQNNQLTSTVVLRMNKEQN